MESFRRGPGTPGPSPLRLAWHNPDPATTAPVESAQPARAALRLVPPPAVPPRAVKLDLAIERHLTGGDGLTRDQFLVAFSGRATRVPVPALS
ncbi:MAG TPA: hypothetical protein VFO85_04115 [Vicinamibacteria bacterium]|nr:hypothetical protein [Vicinamibacteria bacterium]